MQIVAQVDPDELVAVLPLLRWQQVGPLSAAAGIVWFTLDALWGGSPRLLRITQHPLAMCCHELARASGTGRR